MNFKKRYLLLLMLAFLSLYNVYHFSDYCYDALNTFLFLVFSVLFFLVFLIITFYNLYKISLKKERFDFIPGILSLVFFSLVFLSVNYSGRYFHKTQIKSFKSIKTFSLSSYKIILFDDMTFESKTILEKSECTQKGSYFFVKDSLFLNKNKTDFQYAIFDSVYYFNPKENLLIPRNNSLSSLKLDR